MITSRKRWCWPAAMSLCVSGLFCGAQAQTQDSGQRREELARVGECVNDPDPLMRVACLEKIVERGDATETQLAIKTALASKDPELKSIALRGYASSLQDLYLDSSPPKEVEAKVADAQAKSREAAYLARLLGAWQRETGGRVHIRIEKMDLKSGKFVVYGMNKYEKPNEQMRGDGQIIGGRMRMNFALHGLGRCLGELSPTASLTLEGTVTCGNYPKMNLSMPMY